MPIIFRGLALAVLLVPSLLQAEDYDQLPFQKDRKYLRLKGNVMQVSEQSWAPPKDTAVYSTVADTIPVGRRFWLQSAEEAAFDNNGNLVSLSRSAREEEKKKEMRQQDRLFFYQKEKLVAVSNTLDGKKTDSVAFHYRKNGLMDQYSLYHGNDLQYKVTYVYKSGKLFTVRKNNKENFPVSMIRYRYKDGRLNETQHFDEQFRQTETRRYSLQHMPDGLLNDSYSVSGADGKIISGMAWVKDSLGNIQEQSTINADREVTEYHHFVYDDRQFPVEEKVFAAPLEQTISNRYTYDAQGNWTRKEIFVNGILSSVVLRTIRYS